jgi:cysteine desulfurase
MSEQRVYLDYNASTPTAPEAVEAMRVLLTEHYGNPSSAGARAKAAVERARGQVARILGCSADEVVFTSGASESNNHALKGVFFANRDRGGHIVTSMHDDQRLCNRITIDAVDPVSRQPEFKICAVKVEKA